MIAVNRVQPMCALPVPICSGSDGVRCRAHMTINVLHLCNQICHANFRKRVSDCGRKDHIENGFGYSLALVRLHACMHVILNAAKKCSWTLILLGISIAKKCYSEKKTIRTLPTGMNAMKEPVVVL